MKALRRVMPQLNLDQETVPVEILDKLTVTMDDFTNAMREIQPSALREVFVEIPNIRWNDIGGLEEVKQRLKEAVELYLENAKRLGMLREIQDTLAAPGKFTTSFAASVR